MESYVQRWGNSLGIRIPMKIAKQLHLHSGSLVNLEIDENRIIIQVPQYDLNTMINLITPHNQHKLFLDDSQKGNEEW